MNKVESMEECIHIPISDVSEQNEKVLIDSEVEGGRNYCAFPTILQLDPERVLIAYKRGYAHCLDDSALELIQLNPFMNTVDFRSVLEDTSGENCQDPEIMRLPNGDLVIYLDVQTASGKVCRLGIKEFRSHDEGKTWHLERTSLTDDQGIAYGYIFDDVVLGESVYILAMTFPELENQGSGRSVHLLRSDDNGDHWTHVKNLKEEFGYSFNESTFLPLEDGFFVITRGDQNIAKAFRMDRNGNMLAERVLTGRFDCINAFGRPKLFQYDGSYYLLTRNVPKSGGTDLMVYRFDAKLLAPVSAVRLQSLNKPAGNSYYAESYFHQNGENIRFDVITYSDKFSNGPDIVQVMYSWEELRDLLK